jgi:hypothetical protein
MFHIVDDEAWQRALVNMRRLLNKTGLIVVGGQFGLITQNVQFHPTDRIDSPENLFLDRTEKEVLINKRTRSLRRWKKAARDAGLVVKRVVRTDNHNEILTPENNILVLGSGRNEEWC